MNCWIGKSIVMVLMRKNSVSCNVGLQSVAERILLKNNDINQEKICSMTHDFKVWAENMKERRNASF